MTCSDSAALAANANPVARAAKVIGSRSQLARLLGVKPPTVTQWAKGLRPVPPARALQIEKLTRGEVTRADLCPLFPWADAV